MSSSVGLVDRPHDLTLVDDLDDWWRLLPLWAGLVVALFVALVAASIGSQGIIGTGTMVGEQYGRLELAIRNPLLHRTIESLEMLGWLAANFVTPLILARLAWGHAPLRATLAAACAIAVPATGPIGRMTSRDGIGALAPLYADATTPDQQAAVLRVYDAVQLAADPHVNLGVLIVGVASALLGWAVWSNAAFPRWLAAWILVTGLITLTRGLLHELGFPLFPPLLLANNIIGIGGLHVALLVAFARAPRNRPTPHPVSPTPSPAPAL